MNYRVLIVYTDKTTAALLLDAFAAVGMKAQMAGNLREATLAISGEGFGGVFVDPMMSLMDGFTLVTQIRHSPKNSKVPIFFLSAANEGYATARSFEAAGTYYLREPIDRDSLGHLLEGSSEMPPENRRRKPRIPLATEVTGRTLALDLKSTSCDISTDGILFQCDASLELGQKVDLSFSLDSGPPIEVGGVVARTSDNQRALVCFVDIVSEDRKRIQSFVAAKAAG